MFVSKFLLNRQKIFNPWQIHQAIESHFPSEKMVAGRDYLYRLEWYRIGISVPVLVYSQRPVQPMLCKEFQLIDTVGRETIFDRQRSDADFSIFLVPDFSKDFCPADDFDRIVDWFGNRLCSAATIEMIEHGPDNCLYYEVNGENHSQQTITLKGKIRIQDHKALESLQNSCIGQMPELGCGLFLLS